MLILLLLERRERDSLPAGTPADGIKMQKWNGRALHTFRMEPDAGRLVCIDLAQVYRNSGPIEFLGTINSNVYE